MTGTSTISLVTKLGLPVADMVKGALHNARLPQAVQHEQVNLAEVKQTAIMLSFSGKTSRQTSGQYPNSNRWSGGGADLTVRGIDHDW